MTRKNAKHVEASLLGRVFCPRCSNKDKTVRSGLVPLPKGVRVPISIGKGEKQRKLWVSAPDMYACTVCTWHTGAPAGNESWSKWIAKHQDSPYPKGLRTMKSKAWKASELDDLLFVPRHDASALHVEHWNHLYKTELSSIAAAAAIRCLKQRRRDAVIELWNVFGDKIVFAQNTPNKLLDAIGRLHNLARKGETAQVKFDRIINDDILGHRPSREYMEGMLIRVKLWDENIMTRGHMKHMGTDWSGIQITDILNICTNPDFVSENTKNYLIDFGAYKQRLGRLVFNALYYEEAPDDHQEDLDVQMAIGIIPRLGEYTTDSFVNLKPLPPCSALESKAGLIMLAEVTHKVESTLSLLISRWNNGDKFVLAEIPRELRLALRYFKGTSELAPDLAWYLDSVIGNDLPTAHIEPESDEGLWAGWPGMIGRMVTTWINAMEKQVPDEYITDPWKFVPVSTDDLLI